MIASTPPPLILRCRNAFSFQLQCILCPAFPIRTLLLAHCSSRSSSSRQRARRLMMMILFNLCSLLETKRKILGTQVVGLGPTGSVTAWSQQASELVSATLKATLTLGISIRMDVQRVLRRKHTRAVRASPRVCLTLQRPIDSTGAWFLNLTCIELIAILIPHSYMLGKTHSCTPSKPHRPQQ